MEPADGAPPRVFLTGQLLELEVGGGCRTRGRGWPQWLRGKGRTKLENSGGERGGFGVNNGRAGALRETEEAGGQVLWGLGHLGEMEDLIAQKLMEAQREGQGLHGKDLP